MSETARLFFALDVPQASIDVMLETQRTLRAFAERFEPRWCRREQMHLTLKFLGDVPTTAIDELSIITRACAAEAKPFDTVFERITVFPDVRRARVLVMEAKPDPGLAALAEELDEKAERFGVARERRAFRPHLTLARFKAPGNAVFLLESAVLEPLSVQFDELRLYQSLRGEYVPLASAALSAE